MKGESMEGVTFPGIPTPFHWLAGPAVAFAVGVGELTLEAGPGTDWFVDPSGESDATVNSPALVGSIDGDLMLRAFVRPEFVETYDAGVLVLWGDERTWAKLCFEYSPQGVPTVVSVVTRGVSDDCNSISVDGEGIWLRISRLGEAFAFHASIDGSTWQLIRYFALPSTQPLAVGFQAQSPLGAGCRSDSRGSNSCRNGFRTCGAACSSSASSDALGVRAVEGIRHRRGRAAGTPSGPRAQRRLRARA